MAIIIYCTGSALKAEMGAVFVTFIAVVAEIPDARHLQEGLLAGSFRGFWGKTAQLGLHQGRKTEQQRGAHFMVH